jgi:hypothetical protein
VKIQNNPSTTTALQGGNLSFRVTPTAALPHKILTEVLPRRYGIKVEQTEPSLPGEKLDFILTLKNMDGVYSGESLIELLQDLADVLNIIEHAVFLADDDDEDEDDLEDDDLDEEEEEDLDEDETPPPPSRSSEQADGVSAVCTCNLCSPKK